MLILLTIANHLIEIFARPKTKPEFNFVLNKIKENDKNDILLYNPRGTSVFIINYLRNIKPDIKQKLNFYEYKELKNDLDNFWILCYMPEVNFKCKPIKDDNLKITDIKRTRLVQAYFFQK
tara:strand:+ start:230 stop:592 length:363 start_codon:yes stop_codon:yes gene_type:complete